MALFEQNNLFKVALLSLVSPEEELLFCEIFNHSIQNYLNNKLNEKIELNFWDFNVLNQSPSLGKLYFKGTQTLVLLLNIGFDSKISDIYENIILIKESHHLTKLPFPIFVFGNRGSSTNNIESFNGVFCKDLGIAAFKECNVHNGKDSSPLFEEIANFLLNSKL